MVCRYARHSGNVGIHALVACFLKLSKLETSLFIFYLFHFSTYIEIFQCLGFLMKN